jgi:RHH-type transcriptional regulator, proline utilization regulon repressor / proline dehydrogenase / delta 1-pyrroline-5-carboxylate dehydrogenase
MIASSRWDLLDLVKYRDEADTVAGLLAAEPLAASARAAVQQEAIRLVRRTREMTRSQGLVESFLQEFSLSTPEGLALMGLAEALLRTPDVNTRDRLIAEKVAAADWASHLGQSGSLLVNASTWGLMLTGRLVDVDVIAEPENIVRALAVRLGEPVVRAAIAQALRIMSEQFVLGRTISDAISRARREKLLCSFDMLGEGARTEVDAARYEAAYRAAIVAIGKDSAGPEMGHGISVKLSALSPRYEATQDARVWNELYPRLKRLAQQAAEADINFTLDAEEADRLVLSLKLLDRLAREPGLGSWRGLGLAVQAYQKRAPEVIRALNSLARESGRRLMVRLVKGAYWDTEIKRAQVAGRPDYPVFTTKPATDLSYLVCARLLIGGGPHLYPQFATHNAHTLAAVMNMAGPAEVEFQRLHGMGEALYRAATDCYGAIRLRTYAPVGAHAELLPYLVRRLLENGANTSFMHRLLDEEIPVEDVAADPICRLEAAPGPHPQIPLPRDIYGDRKNSTGMDFGIDRERSGLAAAIARQAAVDGRPIVNGVQAADNPPAAVTNPFDRTEIGHSAEASKSQIDAAFAVAAEAQASWDGRGGASRARILRAMADSLEANRERLTALVIREAAKIWTDAAAEVREAADFCHYYALLAERNYCEPAALKGPVGESNRLELHGRGVFACISPWNFPLAIFTGQVAAALAAGNAVVAKPAEQTPLIAAEAVRLFLGAGLPPEVLHLLPGRGETVGAALTAHPRLAGIAFTGGTETARAINRSLAARPGAILPFIAETGGLNAMFADTSALREQLIDDVLLSAFGSAGQRCSALRILFLPEETADSLLESLAGAMDVLNVGDPSDCATDVGPVIDRDAKNLLDRHLATLRASAKIIRQVKPISSAPLLFAPVLAEIGLAQLPDREVFGPVLHIVRYRGDELDRACRALAGMGYGLTLGIHSRLASFAERVRKLVPAGNTYVNRSMIGAVVGVQPFGGEGLSGTGPKAGGPHSLSRYSVERAVSVNIAAQGGDPALVNISG